MKVLHLCKYDFRHHSGGIESVCKSMYEYFKTNSSKHCNQFHFFLFFSSNGISSEHKEEGFHFYTAGTNRQLGSTPLSLPYVKKYIELCNSVDIVHVHVPNPVALFAIYCKSTKAKIIVHWHSDIVKQKLVYPLFKTIEQRVLKATTSIIATSENYVNGSKPLLPFRSKIKVIPIGIQPLVLSQKKETTNQEVHILSIGRLVYYKGFEYLVKSAVYLPDNYRITIVGKGSLQKSLEQLIAALQVNDKVRLAGKITDAELNRLMNDCAVFCLPSVERSEAFGVVLLEALSLGKPVIATNIPYSGVNWVNQHGVTGYNVSPKDEKELAKAIVAVLSDVQQYRQLSKNAFQRFQALFTAEEMNKSIENLYIEIMSNA